MKKLLFVVLLGVVWQTGFAYIYDPADKKTRKKETTDVISLREDCNQPTQKFYQNINNVRAILTNGGDVWTENNTGRYIVPKRENPADEASALYSGAVWLGGKQKKNIKIAISDYRNDREYDFYSGPLREDGTTDKDICDKWDTYFRVYGSEIDKQLKNYRQALEEEEPMNCDSIPEGVKFWPAKGNIYFYEKYKFQLPEGVDLAPFFDQNEDGQYDPCDGDYPVINIEAPAGKGQCPTGVYADEIYFWVYNDAGGQHYKSHGDPIGMEVQVEAFAWSTNDEINDMTFQRYKLINRASEDITDCYFAWWVDPDLGCPYDDYIGCVPPPVNLMYVYNTDAYDGSVGCACNSGGRSIVTYCDRIPIIGVDYFRGPQGHFNFQIDSVFRTDTVDGQEIQVFEKLDTTLIPIGVKQEGDTTVELGMSSFVYYNGNGEAEPATRDPDTKEEYYRILTGYWKDGTTVTRGGTGYNPGSDDTTKYVFPDSPDDINGWSMVTANMNNADRRTVQATGPFVLKPGDVNELIIGVPWVPAQPHPAPGLEQLLVADELAQALFDNCFDLQDGPDAPDVDIVELDQELILVLSNDQNSNNKDENFSEVGIKIETGVEDNLYKFEGYQVYQLINGDVSVQELGDFEKSRLVFQSDIENGIAELYNWRTIKNPSPNGAAEKIFVPIKKVVGNNKGLRHVVKLTNDQFGNQGRLVNHKKYYYRAIAYSANNWQEFRPNTGEGQREPYFPGRRNGKIYTAVPRPINYAKLNTAPGESPQITKTDGYGIANNFVKLTAETEEKILENNFERDLTYQEGFGPFEVEVFDPFEVKDKEYKLELFDNNMDDEVLDSTAYWLLTDLETGNTFRADTEIVAYNQQVIKGEGFSVAIKQSNFAFDTDDENNGAIGGQVTYSDPNGVEWLNIIGDDLGGIFSLAVRDDAGNEERWDYTNIMKTGKGEEYNNLDPNQSFKELFKAASFAPYHLLDEGGTNNYTISPASRGKTNKFKQSNFYITGVWKQALNNVDIVFTSDKSKWSRCIVVETTDEGMVQYVKDLEDMVLPPEGDAKHFKLRAAKSVSKDDNDGDGLPDVDDSGTTGMGWFPGYAIDVATGERLNIFFGEASVYGGTEAVDTLFRDKKATGRDMMFNPSPDISILYPGDLEIPFSSWNWVMGGHHMVYVTNSRYDGCEKFRSKGTENIKTLSSLTWAGVVMSRTDPDGNGTLLSYQDGLIPTEARVELRVNKPYQVPSYYTYNRSNSTNPVVDTLDYRFLRGERKGYGTYLFNFKGKSPGDVEDLERENPLSGVNVVPNPYYAYSEYETSQFDKKVKITNLPGKCNVTIYSIDGKFIRHFDKDEIGADYRVRGKEPGTNGQIYPDLVWDMKNHKGIPVASGVYLIHISSPELNAERTIKWFGTNREFDPTGL